jgi:hypothetical protein
MFESLGERALGMGGAFVAVADDSTATHWNPAGLVAGGPAGATLNWFRFEPIDQDALTHAGPERRRTRFVSVGSWPVGLSYGRFEITGLRATGDAGLRVESFRSRQYGFTFLQSVVQGLVVGTTAKYVRGEVVTDVSDSESIESALDRGDDLEGESSGTFDFDIGVMVDMQQLRVGVTWKNMLEPTFGDVATTAITLQRQARLGVAFLPSAGLTLAMDLDLDTVDFPGDPRRMLAFGGEGKMGRVEVRSGLRWSLEGARRFIGAAGMSLTIRRGLWLDGHYTLSHEAENREYGFALRAGL